MSKLINLRNPRYDHADKDKRFTQVNYKQAAPFFENPRGVLIHRVRAVLQLTATYHNDPWWIVEYWCENNGRSDAVDTGLIFDPGVKLICTRCEANAIAHGEKTSSQLAGRHVCTGICMPVNTCCRKNQN